MIESIDLDLLEQIHDVTLGSVRWEEVLERVRAEFDAELCALRVYAGTPGETRGLSTAGHDGRPWHQYAAHFAAIDPFAAAMRSGRMPAGTLMQGDQLVPPHRFCSGEYYQDWFRPNGLRYVAGAYVRAPEGHYVQMGIPRGPDAGPFDDAELARLQRYFNHIWRALRMQEERAARTPEPDFDALARIFGLTGAEARLIHSLTETGSLKRSAQRIDRSYYTLRAQLRSVFTKTATRSQVELMRLIHQGRQDPERARTGGGRSSR